MVVLISLWKHLNWTSRIKVRCLPEINAGPALHWNGPRVENKQDLFESFYEFCLSMNVDSLCIRLSCERSGWVMTSHFCNRRVNTHSQGM
ncbi:hypothetical protein DPMN_076882 [Dreissena polymorpha]|uniref:Uncharacterized protein n=1 Tax=Dreissena polymorpha TaxID=45954 RepID=A0A9D3YKX4_DREPO|nr:hypothetical protein DPMN_076882 [Dreissena polymorpha]